MKIDVPLEIGDEVWVIKNRKPCSKIIMGVRQYKWNDIISTVYNIANYRDEPIDFTYFLSEKNAEIEIARRILEDLKDEN